MIRNGKSTTLVALTGGWIVLVSSCMVGLAVYSSIPAELPSVPQQLPDDPRIISMGDQFTMVTFLHPKCPCSRATIAELARLLSSTGSRIAAYAVFIQPEGMGEGWCETPLWRAAGRVQGLTLVRDNNCELARKSGAGVSGQVMLYDTDGHLVFNGGITVARGHEGDSPGRSQILASLGVTPEVPELRQQDCSVFGCPLFNQTEAPRAGETQ